MANPYEYRERMWKLVYLGENPPPKAPPQQSGRRGARRKIGLTKGALPSEQSNAMAAMLERVAKAKAAKEAADS